MQVDKEKLTLAAKEHWNVDLGACVKASQNHTFLTTRGEEKYVLRVTPDPENKRLESTELEVDLLEYLHDNKLPVCPPIRSSVTNKSVVQHDAMILCLFTFATGDPVVYTDWKWMQRDIVVGLGRWFGLLHKLTRQYAADRPEMASRARLWTTLHDGILATVPVDTRDIETASNPMHFTVIHGDVNPSNYFWDASLGMPSMFDWDQLQKSWLLYDLSAPIWGVVSLERAGSPIDRSPCPQANSTQYTQWLLEGYEPTLGETVDRDALQRMVLIRRQLYIRFCRAAIHELPPDHGMQSFCKFMVDFFEKEEADELAAANNINPVNTAK
eukprot:gene15044-17798_t